MEGPDSVASPADARHDEIGETTEGLPRLGADFATDHALEITYDRGIRVGSDGGAQEIVRGPYVRDPISKSFIDGVSQSPATRLYLTDLRPQELHPFDVRALAFDVLRTHVDLRRQPQRRADHRRCNPVLAGPGLSNESMFAHPSREKTLTERIVEFVSAPMNEILAFQPDFRSPGPTGEVFREVERSRTPSECSRSPGQFASKSRVDSRFLPGFFELRQRRHQGLGHERSPVRTEISRHERIQIP